MIIFIIKNADEVPLATAIDEQKAIEICKENKDKNWFYQKIKLYKSKWIELKIINNKPVQIK